MPLKARDVKAALLDKGFKEAHNKDHHYYYFYVEGKRTSINTKISRGETEIHDQNCSNMARQMSLTSAQFREFVQCLLTAQIYLKMVKEKHAARPPSIKPGPKGSG